jgi:hypothetical protein
MVSLLVPRLPFPFGIADLQQDSPTFLDGSKEVDRQCLFFHDAFFAQPKVDLFEIHDAVLLVEEVLDIAYIHLLIMECMHAQTHYIHLLITCMLSIS